MRYGRWLSLSLVAALGLLASAPVALAQESDAEILDKSAGWGIDRDSGRVAIDASLLVFWDPENRTLVVNPDYEAEAAADVGAEVQADGSWLMPEAGAVVPVRGDVRVLTGEEPDELREISEARPNTTVDRVELTQQIGAGATKTRIFSRCTGCLSCPLGCSANILWGAAGRYRACEPNWPWRTCKTYWRPVCPYQIFGCIGCTGPILGTGYGYDWSCGTC